MPMSVKVELVGMLPEFFRMCPRAAGTCALAPAEEQMQEYSLEVRETQVRFAAIYSRLLTEFGGRAVPVSVGYLSLRGFWLSLRYGLGQDAVVVVGGARPIPLSAGYDAVRRTVQQALGRP